MADGARDRLFFEAQKAKSHPISNHWSANVSKLRLYRQKCMFISVLQEKQPSLQCCPVDEGTRDGELGLEMSMTRVTLS